MIAEEIIAHSADTFGGCFTRRVDALAPVPRKHEIAAALYPPIADRLDWAAYAADARPRFEAAVRATVFPDDSGQIAQIRQHSANREAFLEGLCKYYIVRDEKFCLIEPWLDEKLAMVAFLNLDRTSGLSVLDLGAAVGHFSLLCEAAGHRVIGVDIEQPVFQELSGALGLDCRVDPVHPHFFRDSLPGERFDLITGFLVNFNIDGERLWDAAAWDIFLEEARARLEPEGRLCLLLNTQTGRPGLKAHDGSLQRHLVKHGFKVYQNAGFYAGPRLCLYRNTEEAA